MRARCFTNSCQVGTHNHQEFPYLTISESIDVAAGIRYCARHCFVLETLSINIKPKVQITSPRGYEGMQVFLKDDLWMQLLGTSKYRIDGEERWLIGENEGGEVVILFFDRDEVSIKSLQVLPSSMGPNGMNSTSDR